MRARMQQDSWAKGCGFLGLALLALTGCAHSRGSRACSGGCCQGRTYGGAAPPASAVANPTPLATRQPGLDSSGAVKELPTTTTSTTARGTYGGQKTCPVTGEELGSMGPPVPVVVKGETVYVCCRGCAAKVQRDPDIYLVKVRAERAGQ